MRGSGRKLTASQRADLEARLNVGTAKSIRERSLGSSWEAFGVPPASERGKTAPVRRTRGITTGERIKLEAKLNMKMQEKLATAKAAALTSSVPLSGSDDATSRRATPGRQAVGRRQKGLSREEAERAQAKVQLTDPRDVKAKVDGRKSPPPTRIPTATGRRVKGMTPDEVRRMSGHSPIPPAEVKAKAEEASWAPFATGASLGHALTETQEQAQRVVEAAGYAPPRSSMTAAMPEPSEPVELRRSRILTEQWTISGDTPKPVQPRTLDAPRRSYDPKQTPIAGSTPRERAKAMQASSWAPTTSTAAAPTPVSSLPGPPPSPIRQAKPTTARGRMQAAMQSSWAEPLSHTQSIRPSTRGGIGPPPVPEVSARSRMRTAMKGSFTFG